MKKLFLFSILTIFLFVTIVCVQASAQKVTITVISANTHSFGPSSSDPSKVKVEEEVRDPTAEDIINGIKSKGQVAITIPQSNGTARWAHTMRVRAVNLTRYNSTNEENKTVYYNDIKVYDPTTGKNYTTQIAYIFDAPNRAYINWNGWVSIRDVVIIKSHASIRWGGLLQKVSPIQFLPLVKFAIPKFH